MLFVFIYYMRLRNSATPAKFQNVFEDKEHQ